jgi:hypothetical protein
MPSQILDKRLFYLTFVSVINLQVRQLFDYQTDFTVFGKKNTGRKSDMIIFLGKLHERTTAKLSTKKNPIR